MTDLVAVNPGAEDALARMETRRSTNMTMLSAPGPSADQLRRMLTIAARVPDHGMLEPWRFIVLEGGARQQAGDRLAAIYEAENAGKDPASLEKFKGVMSRVFSYAPVIVIVVSRTDPNARKPAWEQDLSAGAVCMNLLHAADALGFAATWLTGFAAYSPGAAAMLGLQAAEKAAGLIHIGTAREKQPERKRPDLEAIATWWKA